MFRLSVAAAASVAKVTAGAPSTSCYFSPSGADEDTLPYRSRRSPVMATHGMVASYTNILLAMHGLVEYCTNIFVAMYDIVVFDTKILVVVYGLGEQVL